MIDFLDLYEKQKKKEEDRIYFSGALDKKGRRYSQEFETEVNVVASGGFGFLRISKLKSKSSEKTFLTKVISKENVFSWQLRNKSLIEVDILSSINHDNIVKVVGAFENDFYQLLVMERCEGITLFQCVELNSALPESAARIISKQVFSAISHLHNLSIVHGDIKDENVMVDSQLKVKLIDFGSAQFDDRLATTDYCGSETFSSPQVLAGKRYLRVPQEIWACGVLLFVMVLGVNPFDNVVSAEEGVLKFPSAPKLSEACIALISSMIVKDLDQRASLESVMCHGWLSDSPDDHYQELCSLKFSS